MQNELMQIYFMQTYASMLSFLTSNILMHILLATTTISLDNQMIFTEGNSLCPLWQSLAAPANSRDSPATRLPPWHTPPTLDILDCAD